MNPFKFVTAPSVGTRIDHTLQWLTESPLALPGKYVVSLIVSHYSDRFLASAKPRANAKLCSTSTTTAATIRMRLKLLSLPSVKCDSFIEQLLMHNARHVRWLGVEPRKQGCYVFGMEPNT